MTVSFQCSSGMSRESERRTDTGAAMRTDPVLGTGPIGLLLVEDSVPLRNIMQAAALADGRFSVVGVAGDGETALTVAEQTRPDAVILDHMMPARTGLDILPELRRLLPEATIIVWSSAQQALQGAIELGATDVRTKETTVPDLLDLLAVHQHVR